jgi:hypothetical protein
MRSQLKRLEKIEAPATDDIPVWCLHEADMHRTIDAMIAEGEIREDDRPRCVHCLKAKHSRKHEVAIDEMYRLLDAGTRFVVGQPLDSFLSWREAICRARYFMSDNIDWCDGVSAEDLHAAMAGYHEVYMKRQIDDETRAIVDRVAQARRDACQKAAI